MDQETGIRSKKKQPAPPRLALLGLGAMGSRMAKRLATGPYELRVWSRSGVSGDASALTPLAVSSPIEAVEGADVIISMLRDDVASRAVWLEEKNGALLGAQVKYVGDSPAGSVAKLVVNSFFGLQVAALAELLSFAERSGLELAAVVELLKDLPVMSPAANAASANMLKGRFEPLFPVELVHKDLLYAEKSAEAVGSRLPLTEKTRQVFEASQAKGWGNENLTTAIKLYRA